MKLYHGSLEIVERPVIRVPNRTLDYGNGFMRTEVNQNNLPLLIPGKVTGMTKILCEKLQLNTLDCLKIIYSSKTYKLLEQEDSKYWHYGPVALCEILKEEILNK